MSGRERKPHYYQCVKAGKEWAIVASATKPNVFPDREGAVIVEATRTTRVEVILERADGLANRGK